MINILKKNRFIIEITLIMGILKLIGILEWDWIAIFMPIWLPLSFWILMYLTSWVSIKENPRNEDKNNE